jgi:hypothetical protein
MVRTTAACLSLTVALLAGGGGGRAAERPAAPEQPPVDVGGNGHTFVGHGTIPGTGDGSDGNPGSGCTDCQWLLEPVCTIDDMGTPPRPGVESCLPVPGNCPPDQTYLRVWTNTGGRWHTGDTLCSADPPGVTVAQLAAAVRDRVRHHVPVVHPTRQPQGRAVIHIPVLFDSGQPSGSQVWTDDLAGMAVTTEVWPTWTWAFGDGATLTTKDSGSTWPDTAVSHAYDRRGHYRPTLQVVWRGTFTVTGLGTFPIDGDVTQEGDLPVALTGAGAVLVPNH